MVRLSLHARVGLGAAVASILVLIITTISLTGVVDLTLSESMDERLDVQIRAVEVAFGPNGHLDRSRLFQMREMELAETNWGWQAQSPRGTWQGGIPVLGAFFAVPHMHVIDGVYSGNGHAPDGTLLRLRRRDIATPGGTLSIIVAAPEATLLHPLRRVDEAIRLRIGLLALALALASWIQLRAGLQPLRHLRDQVVRLRSGESRSVTSAQPAELLPLASELNDLMARNTAGLESARNHVANLAHAIKTPLASLALQLEHEDATPDSRQLVAQIGGCIAHHLRRARSAAVGLGDRARCDVLLVAEGQMLTMRRLFAERAVSIDNRIDELCPVLVDGEDLNEMLGNLLENACRFARSKVIVTCEVGGRHTCIAIQDDGPGIPAEAIAIAMKPGYRLDEQSEGYGFGLVITRELVDLYGGDLELSVSQELGGLRAAITIPRHVP